MAIHPTPNVNASRASVRLYKQIALTFLGLTLVLLGVVLAATLSRAEITVTTKPMPVKSELKVVVASANQTADSVSGYIVTTEVSGEKTVKPTGEGKATTGKATGTVTLVNKRPTAQPLVATTRLITKDGVLFRLKKSVSIPAGGELKNVEVYADKDGQASQIGPSSFTIPGLPAELQKLVYASSELPMSGGGGTVRVVVQSDIDQALSDLKDELTQKATAVWAVDSKAVSFKGKEISVQEVARTSSAKAGDSLDSFSVLLKLNVTGVFYDQAKLDNLGLAALKEALPAETQFDSASFADPSVTVQNFSASSGTATLDVVFGGRATITSTSPVLEKSRLVGLDAETVKSYLKSFDSIADASVKLSPFWVKKTPTMKDHIILNVK